MFQSFFFFHLVFAPADYLLQVTLSRAKAKPAGLVRELPTAVREKKDKKKIDGQDVKDKIDIEDIGREEVDMEIGREEIGRAEIVLRKTVHIKNTDEGDNIEEIFMEKNELTEEKVETSEVELGLWNIEDFFVVVSSEESDEEIDFSISQAYIKNITGASVEMNNNEALEQDNSYEDKVTRQGEDHSYIKESRSVVKQSLPEESDCEEDKTMKGMEDQRRRNETQFVKKIKKFKHGSFVFHVCVCTKKFVTASSARAHAANKCFQRILRRKGEHCICLICSASFKSKLERRKHTQKVHPLAFPCHRCGCKFSRKKTWNRHVLACERGEKTHKCEACGYQSNSRGNMWKHKKMHSSKSRVKSVQGAQYKPVAGDWREEFGHLGEGAAEIKNIKIECVENLAVITNRIKSSVLNIRQGSRQLFQKLKSTALPFPVSATAAKGDKLALCSDSGDLAILTFCGNGEIASELAASVVLSEGETAIKPVWLSWDGPADRVGLLTSLSLHVFDIDVKKLDPIFTFPTPGSNFTDGILIKNTLLEPEDETPEEENIWLSGIIQNLKKSQPGTYIIMNGVDGTLLLVKKLSGIQNVKIRHVGEETYSLSSVQVKVHL